LARQAKTPVGLFRTGVFLICGHIPHRNLVLIGAAVAALQPRVMYLGVLRGETSRDKSSRFLRQTSRLLSFCEAPVRVISPSKRLTRTQLADRAIWRARRISKDAFRGRTQDRHAGRAILPNVV
jgi:hypothetical protein